MCSNILSITIYKKFVNILYTILTKRIKECILIIVIDKNSFYQNISLLRRKLWMKEVLQIHHFHTPEIRKL